MVTDQGGHPIQVLTVQLEDEYRLFLKSSALSNDIKIWLSNFPTAWAETGGMGFAAHRPPLLIELKLGVAPIQVKQYPMTQEARQGIMPNIRRLLKLGILVPCQSSWNFPLLPVKKAKLNGLPACPGS